MKIKRFMILAGIFILTLIPNYLIYRRVIYSYLFDIRSFYLFKFINTPYFAADGDWFSKANDIFLKVKLAI